jgi:hypothetical protein
VIDTTASPSTTYHYKAIQLEGTARTLESDVVQVTMLDTTSHAVQWQVDTLGARGEIFDVWAFSRDNIWAVGEIFLKDSTGNVDPVLYNAARYDGVRWQAIRIPTRSVGGSTGAATLRTIFCFSPSDIWVFAYHGAYAHGNGSQWQTQLGTGGETKLWGTSSSNLFVVGSNGAISHYDGTRWERMDSGTDVDLEDVWGLDNEHVWATGTNIDDGRCVVLQYDGRNWKTIYDNNGKPRELDFGFSTVWTDNLSVLYLAGGSRLRRLTLHSSTFGDRVETGQTYVSYRVRATAQNDLFVAAAGGDLVHGSGVSWHLYPELKQSGGSAFAFWYAVHPARDFIVIGGELFTGLFGIPVVVRGSR